MLELLVNKFEQEMCSGRTVIVKQNADTVCNACKMQIQFAMRANADKFANAMYTLVRCELKCDPVSIQ